MCETGELLLETTHRYYSDVEEHCRSTNRREPIHAILTAVYELEAWKAAAAVRLSSAIKSALPGGGEGPKDCAGVLVHDLTKVHGDGE
jgi:hypothetical protein